LNGTRTLSIRVPVPRDSRGHSEFIILLRYHSMIQPYLRACPDDIRYAYRLLLGREPDAEGLKHHGNLVGVNGLSTRDLAWSIMTSAEYQAQQGADSALREVEVDGVKLFPWQGDHLIGDHIQAGASYEPNVLPLFLQSLAEGNHVLDVGANVGIFTLLAAN